MRGNCWLDAILMARYTQQYIIDIVIGLENGEDHHEVGGWFSNQLDHSQILLGKNIVFLFFKVQAL